MFEFAVDDKIYYCRKYKSENDSNEERVPFNTSAKHNSINLSIRYQ